MISTPTQTVINNRVIVDVRENIIQRINKRRKHLVTVANRLKNRFVGLDDVIDNIIRNIEVWYVMPEVITRPVIINLWGMTGVGKTDLVRQLVKELKFNDKFLEIQLCNSGSATNYHSTLNSTLSCSNLESKQPGILLLDEMQRFRTVGDDGKEILDYKFQDVWMMLSDGRFSGDTNKESIMRVLFEHVYYSVPDNNSNNKTKAKPVTINDKKEYRQSYYSAKMLKRALRLTEPVEEIMYWDDDKKMQIAMERMEDQSTYEGDDFSKVLIFISGNLDEAYKMSGDCSDSNKDADVLHAFSKQINVVTIKNALIKRFKPEQISRLGNTHVIYPSLSKTSYEKIIKRKIKAVLDGIHANHGVRIQVDKSVYDFVYRNGVFPSQGVRPVFSTISSYIENLMPLVVLEAVTHGIKSVKISYDNKLTSLIATNGAFQLVIKCEGVIDNIKKHNNCDQRVKTSVHEAAHAIAYGVLFGLAPTQMTANMASEYTAGFVGIHSINYTKDNLLDILQVYMAGGVAEEIVFGSDFISSGHSGDIASATALIMQAIKEWGMFDHITKVEAENLSSFSKLANNNNSPQINELSEDILLKQRALVKEVLLKHLPLLKEISDVLVAHGKMSPEQFQEICKKYQIEVKIFSPEISLIDNYTDKYKEFFNKALVSP